MAVNDVISPRHNELPRFTPVISNLVVHFLLFSQLRQMRVIIPYFGQAIATDPNFIGGRTHQVSLHVLAESDNFFSLLNGVNSGEKHFILSFGVPQILFVP